MTKRKCDFCALPLASGSAVIVVHSAESGHACGTFHNSPGADCYQYAEDAAQNSARIAAARVLHADLETVAVEKDSL